MKTKTKDDAYKSILVISLLAILAVAIYIAVTLTGFIGYPLGDANAFVGAIGVVLAVAGGGLILYPEDRTTGVGIAVLVVGGFMLVQTLFSLMA